MFTKQTEVKKIYIKMNWRHIQIVKLWPNAEKLTE